MLFSRTTPRQIGKDTIIPLFHSFFSFFDSISGWNSWKWTSTKQYFYQLILEWILFHVKIVQKTQHLGNFLFCSCLRKNWWNSWKDKRDWQWELQFFSNRLYNVIVISICKWCSRKNDTISINLINTVNNLLYSIRLIEILLLWILFL